MHPVLRYEDIAGHPLPDFEDRDIREAVAVQCAEDTVARLMAEAGDG